MAGCRSSNCLPCFMPLIKVASPVLQIEEKAADLQAAISEGANSFLYTEYKYVSVFMVSRRLQGNAAA
jgi:hypothetical protein